jgi:hypothetical protein
VGEVIAEAIKNDGVKDIFKLGDEKRVKVT